MRSAFKNVLISLLFSSVVTFAAAQAVQCAPADKNGAPLVGAGTSSGDGFVTCTYGSGACEYFAQNGENESGSSSCPAGIPQGSAGSGESSSTTAVVTTSSSTSITAVKTSTSSAAQVTTVSSSTQQSSSSTTTVAITSTVTPPAAAPPASSTSGFVTLPSASISTTSTPVTSTSAPTPTGNSAASVFRQGSVSSVIGIMMVVAAVNFV